MFFWVEGVTISKKSSEKQLVLKEVASQILNQTRKIGKKTMLNYSLHDKLGLTFESSETNQLLYSR